MSIDKLPPAPDPQPNDPLFGEVGMTAPETVHVGFENAPPTPDERAAFDQHRAAVRDSHPSIKAGFSRRENETTPEAYGTQVKRRLKIGGIKAIVAGVVTVVGGFTGLAYANSNHHDTNTTPPDVKPPVAEAPVVPGQVAPAPAEQQPATVYKPAINLSDCPVNVAPNSPDAEMPPSAVECGQAFNELSNEQQQTILRLEQMSVPDFYKQPLPDQQKFANFVVKNRADVVAATINDILTEKGLTLTGTKMRNYNPSTEMVDDITNQDVQQLNYAWNTVLYGTTVKNNKGEVSFDGDTGKKLLSIIAPYNSSVFNDLTHVIDNSTNASALDNGGFNFVMFTQNFKTESAEKTTYEGSPAIKGEANLYNDVGNDSNAKMGDSSIGIGVHPIQYIKTVSTTIDGKDITNVLVSTIGPVE